jgi:hypothetical protein
LTFMKLRFMKSPSFAKQNSYCYYAVRGLGNAERSQELKPYEPEADNTDGGSISFSQYTCIFCIFWELLRRFGNFSGRRFSFFKNKLFEKGKC